MKLSRGVCSFLIILWFKGVLTCKWDDNLLLFAHHIRVKAEMVDADVDPALSAVHIAAAVWEGSWDIGL